MNDLWNDLSSALLLATLAAPLALLAACFVKGWRPRALALQWIAPAPALAAGLLGLNAAPVSFDLPGLGFTLAPRSARRAAARRRGPALDRGHGRRLARPRAGRALWRVLAADHDRQSRRVHRRRSRLLLSALRPGQHPGLWPVRLFGRCRKQARRRHLHGLRHSRRGPAAARLRRCSRRASRTGARASPM